MARAMFVSLSSRTSTASGRPGAQSRSFFPRPTSRCTMLFHSRKARPRSGALRALRHAELETASTGRRRTGNGRGGACFALEQERRGHRRPLRPPHRGDGRLRPLAQQGSRHRSEESPWFDDPIALAQSSAIDVFVELIGGDGGPALQSVEAALSVRQACGHGEQGAARPSRRGARRACGKEQRRLELRGRGRRRHPHREVVAREHARQLDFARLRHSERHEQLHPHAHAARGAALRRRAARGAGAGIRRGRSDIRRRRPGRGPQACAARRASLSASARISAPSISKAFAT